MEYFICAIAVFRIAYLFVYEDGPLGVFVWLRQASEGVPVLGAALSCIYCFSLWCAPPALLLYSRGPQWVVELLALSGGAIFCYEALEALRAFAPEEQQDEVEG